MVSISSVEITTESNGHFGMAGVVGGIQHEFAQGLKVALDAIEVAGGGWRRDEFDVVQRSPFTDQRRPVQRQVVVDQVDAQVFGVPAADVLVEGQYLGGALG